MPGSLQLAQPSTVLPNTFCTSFVETTAWTIVQPNTYPDGRVQTNLQVSQPRHAWALAKRLTYSQFNTLKTFYEARSGGLQPFYFYPDPANFDASGTSTTGRYTVRFDGAFQHTYGLARFDVSVSLIEIS